MNLKFNQLLKKEEIKNNFFIIIILYLQSISNPLRVPTECRHHGGKTIRARQVKINASLPRHLIYRNTNNDCLTKSLFV
jgi:hypothetical protein